MAIIDWMTQQGPWIWIVSGLVMLGLELVLPGGFLLWMGVAGILTGLVSLVIPLGLPAQWVMFGVLSLAAILAWLRLFRNRPAPTDRPYLNRRSDRFVGQEAVLDEAITSGFGRLTLGDTIWRVSGPDLPAGTRVRVVAAEGNMLKVEAA